MGNADSAQTLGERVLAARKKLAEDKKMLDERYEYLETNSPDTMSVMMESIASSFKRCSPFSEPTLLIAWKSNPDKCKKVVLDSCQKVLSAPIKKDEYEWFQQYVFPSSLWMFEIKKNRFMYQELLDIAKNMSQEIIDSMDSIYNHLEAHTKFSQLIDIKNQTLISRQDDKKVGLLQEKGVRVIAEMKNDDDEKKADDIQGFIDANLAVDILMSKGKAIDREFQNHIQTIMCHYGVFKSGPMKKVERCVSKLENDYPDAAFPKAAKLLDIVRCSITFNTVDQLITGYKGLMKHIKNNPSMLQLSRVKNGFLDKHDGGYRDVKINVVYKSQIDVSVSMICEIQLLFGQYLHEKKRIHKLYNMMREEIYFKMVVSDQNQNKKENKDVKELNYTPTLNVVEEVKIDYTDKGMFKCSIDPSFGLLAMEGKNWFGCIDMAKKKTIFTETTNPGNNRHSHYWVNIKEQKYLSIQTAKNIIKMYQVVKAKKKYTFKENAKFRISMKGSDTINFCQFDKNFENILIVINELYLQIRSMKNVNKVKVNIQLNDKLKGSECKQFSLSNDGRLCVIGAGFQKNFFYLVDIENKEQYKLTSNVLKDSYSPCFINGNSEYIAIGDMKGKMEIWDIENKVAIKTLQTGTKEWILCTCSINNILAIGSEDKMIRLFDVTKWELFYSAKYEFKPKSLHLTADLKYLTIGGYGKEKCVVLQI